MASFMMQTCFNDGDDQNMCALNYEKIQMYDNGIRLNSHTALNDSITSDEQQINIHSGIDYDANAYPSDDINGASMFISGVHMVNTESRMNTQLLVTVYTNETSETIVQQLNLIDLDSDNSQRFMVRNLSVSYTHLTLPTICSV